MDIVSFVQPVTFVTCFILGEFFKLLFKKMNKKYLPYYMGIIGMILTPVFLRELSVNTVIQGLLSGFASSGGYDALKTLISDIKDI